MESAAGGPAVPPGPIVSLVYRVSAGERTALLAFLATAFPTYERPGGVRMGLYESVDEPGLVLELVAYADEPTYARDQERVEKDPEMRALLSRWRALFQGPVEVRRMRPLPVAAPPEARRSVEDAALNDHDAVVALLRQAELLVPGRDDAPVPMLVVREGTELVGCAGFERHGEAALLRSVAVRPEARKRGVGEALVEAACARLRTLGVREVFLLTKTAEAFFSRRGFTPVERSTVAAGVRRSTEFAADCCSTCTCMRRGL
jgi:amino-acid N-acetyltransferase